VRLAPDEIASAFRGKKVDAIVALGAPASRQMGEIVADAARGVKGAIQFIEIEESEAIAKRIPALESVEVDQGVFGGRPPRPAESFNTLGFTVRLVATPKLDSDAAADLVRQLYQLRQNISTAIPGAGLMETPDTDEPGAFLIHQGVRDYLSGDQKTLFDRYSDWIYFGAFIASGLGSALAGMFSWFGMRRDGDPAEPLRRIKDLLDRVPQAASADELNAIERQADDIFNETYMRGVKNDISASAIGNFEMGLRELRGRIALRRAALSA
jgi:hypothetical protein